jgi:ankyrin repeat protein
VLKGSSKCAACNFVGYCGAEHQKAHWKVHKPQCKIITQILALPAELVNERFVDGMWKGQTPLVAAASFGATGLALHLLNRGADINAKNTDGRTALILACYEGMTDVAKLLVERGADVNAKDIDGDTPLSSAVKGNHPQLAAFLRTVGTTGL